jgi:hypothetical protein
MIFALESLPGMFAIRKATKRFYFQSQTGKSTRKIKTNKFFHQSSDGKTHVLSTATGTKALSRLSLGSHGGSLK